MLATLKCTQRNSFEESLSIFYSARLPTDLVEKNMWAVTVHVHRPVKLKAHGSCVVQSLISAHLRRDTKTQNWASFLTGRDPRAPGDAK
ncbi:hypothetical protein CDAR_233941 [Caerostris darwini]|uniref:Uncharacterized protein n=1 Tax=Caerostris darwini TaxID=1538125 RepID=A0AAV4R9E1_9ARAC|nr:hypothetical protein CDAR_233941 [Caerostris darwini]